MQNYPSCPLYCPPLAQGQTVLLLSVPISRAKFRIERHMKELTSTLSEQCVWKLYYQSSCGFIGRWPWRLPTGSGWTLPESQASRPLTRAGAASTLSRSNFRRSCIKVTYLLELVGLILLSSRTLQKVARSGKSAAAF